jgi:hypothetical protein
MLLELKNMSRTHPVSIAQDVSLQGDRCSAISHNYEEKVSVSSTRVGLHSPTTQQHGIRTVRENKVGRRIYQGSVTFFVMLIAQSMTPIHFLHVMVDERIVSHMSSIVRINAQGITVHLCTKLDPSKFPSMPWKPQQTTWWFIAGLTHIASFYCRPDTHC